VECEGGVNVLRATAGVEDSGETMHALTPH